MPKNIKEQNLVTAMAAILITVTIIVGFVAIILKQTNSKEEAQVAQAAVQAQGLPSSSQFAAVPGGTEASPVAAFNKPDRMLGVFVEPGRDFLLGISDELKAAASPQEGSTLPDIELNEDKAKEEIDQMLKRTQDLGMNTLFVKTNTALGTVPVLSSVRAISTFDTMSYLLEKAREQDFYVYALYDLSLLPDGNQIKRLQEVNLSSIEEAVKPLSEFAKTYKVDGILLDGCQNTQTATSYDTYTREGGGMTFDQYMISNTSALVSAGVAAIRSADSGIQVGLAADAVWATQEQNPAGLPVSAEADPESIALVTEKASLKGSFADTKAIAESGLLDFMAVKDYNATENPAAPFETVLNWWDEVASQNNLTCYTIHAADRAVTWQDGWGGKAQLADQFSAVLKSPAMEGSVFNSLRSLVNNPNGVTTALKATLANTTQGQPSNADTNQAKVENEDTNQVKVNSDTQRLRSNEDEAFAALPQPATEKVSYQYNIKTLASPKKLANKIIKPKTSVEGNKPANTDNSPITNGKLVKVTSEQAITFPVDKMGIYPNPDCYPLPNGTMDYVVGDKVSVKDGDSYRTYYKLSSGRRVYSTDVKAVSDGTRLEGNTISGMTVKATGDYTYVILKSDKPVAFLPNYAQNKFTIDFKYTDSTPGDLDLSKNPLFSSAYWSGSKLSLKFLSQGGFLGYKAYNEDGNIVFRFNNPTGISGSRIVVDPGHGGADPGAEKGLDRDWTEKRVNWELSQKIATALEERGANVLLLNTYTEGYSMDSRLSQARNFNAQIYLCIHNNSSDTNFGATGSEAYYFFPFAKSLAAKVSAATSTALSTGNRGAQYDVFYVTRDPQFVGILSESGFLTTKREYQKLKSVEYQTEIGNKMASSVADFLESAGAENAGITGTQSVGAAADATDGPTSSSGGAANPDGAGAESGAGESEAKATSAVSITGNGAVGVKSIAISAKNMELSVGDEKELVVKINGNQEALVTYITSNSAVATVDEFGLITATGVGVANISVVSGNQKGVCKVTVQQGSSHSTIKGTEADTGVEIPVSNVKIVTRTNSINVGESTRLTLEFYPAGATNKGVSWDVSSGEKYLEISSDGVITGLKSGYATVHVTTDDGYYSDEIEIEIF